MAIAYLNEGAVSLTSGNWSDSTGFANNATLVINKPIGGNQPVTTSVDWSGLTEGVHCLDIRPGATGQLGTAATPLMVDADDDSATDSLAYVSNYGSGFHLYLRAKGDDNLILNNSTGAGNQTTLIEGEFTNTSVRGGVFRAEQSAELTNYDQYGGEAEIEYNATPLTLCRVTGGRCIIRRKFTKLIVGGNAKVLYIPDDQVTSFTGTTIEQYSGTLYDYSGQTLTILSLGGTHDFSNLQIDATPGATSWLVGGTDIKESAFLDTSNLTYLYGMKRVSSSSQQSSTPIP